MRHQDTCHTPANVRNGSKTDNGFATIAYLQAGVRQQKKELYWGPSPISPSNIRQRCPNRLDICSKRSGSGFTESGQSAPPSTARADRMDTWDLIR